jgi:hypothetical protein
MALFKNKPFIFALLWMGLFAWTTVSEACYFPDGIQATDNTPCYKNGTVSVCCGPGFTCLSNGLCQQGQNLLHGRAMRVQVSAKVVCCQEVDALKFTRI